jgi:hypothetical protein
MFSVPEAHQSMPRFVTTNASFDAKDAGSAKAQIFFQCLPGDRISKPTIAKTFDWYKNNAR